MSSEVEIAESDAKSADEKMEMMDEEMGKNGEENSEEARVEMGQGEGITDDVDGINIANENVAITIDASAVDVLDAKAQKQYNTYAAKKTVAQGMMDIALITANANQLRYTIELNQTSPTYHVVVSLIIVSILLQIAVGVCLIFKGRLDLRGKSKDQGAKRINSYVVAGIFLITVINVFIASFTTT